MEEDTLKRWFGQQNKQNTLLISACVIFVLPHQVPIETVILLPISFSFKPPKIRERKKKPTAPDELFKIHASAIPLKMVFF